MTGPFWLQKGVITRLDFCPFPPALGEILGRVGTNPLF